MEPLAQVWNADGFIEIFNEYVEPGSLELLSADLMMTSAVIKIPAWDQVPVFSFLAEKLHYSGMEHTTQGGKFSL